MPVGDGVGEAVDRGLAGQEQIETVVVGDVAQGLGRGVEDDAAERGAGVDRGDREACAGIGVAVVGEELAPQVRRGRVLVDGDVVVGRIGRLVDVGDVDRERLLDRKAVGIGRAATTTVARLRLEIEQRQGGQRAGRLVDREQAAGIVDEAVGQVSPSISSALSVPTSVPAGAFSSTASSSMTKSVGVSLGASMKKRPRIGS
jgi:hypothetical protein